MDQIDIESEKLITLTEAAKIAPGRPCLQTVWRWATSGCRGVRLATLVCGGRRFTSREAIARFVAATTAAATGQPAPTRTPRQRARAVAAAEKELERAGI